MDLTPIGGIPSQGASALVKRCMVEYNWDEDKARKVLLAYYQFIMLKKELNDWDATVLSPCYWVDRMWHSAFQAKRMLKRLIIYYEPASSIWQK